MTRIVLAVALLLALALPAHAQVTPFAPAPEAAEPEPPAAELEDLIRILEDDAARSRLIEVLRAAAAEEEAPPPAPRTLASQLAEYTADFASGTFALVAAVSEFLESLGGVLATDLDRLGLIVLNIAAVVLAAFAALAVARLATVAPHRRMDAAAVDGGFIRRLGLLLGSTAIDAGTVFLASGVGWIVALWISPPGRLGFNQALFLNAFVLIELVKVALRALLTPGHGPVRLFRMSDTSAAYWYFWFSRLVSVVGYTFLFAAPILVAHVSAASAEAARVVVLLSTLVIACLIILQNRDEVRRRLVAWARRNNSDVVGRALIALAGIWHIVAIVYIAAVFMLWLVNPEEALPFALSATLRSLVAVVIGILLLTLITRLAARGMDLPEDIRERLPLLEQRINAFVPNVLQVVRIVVMVGMIVAIAQAWHLADIVGWLAAEAGQRTMAAIISSALILLVGGLTYLALASWVEYRLNPNYGTVPTARERTLLSLFRSAITVVLAVLVVMLVLSELGVNIGPLLAGAGVVGLAIGFGAQKLVQDIISGVFIQFENAMNEGDVVTAGGITGVVEKLTIRSVSLRTIDGVYHVIPFSSVEAVSNFMKHFSFHVASIGVAYRERIPEVKQAMSDAFERLKDTELFEHLIGDIEVHGVTDFADSAVMVRARIKTAPGMQWAVGRAYNEIIKEIFDERGIEIPFPHLTLYMGQDKEGAAPPLHIARAAPDEIPDKPAPKRRSRAAKQKHDNAADEAPKRRRRRKPKQTAPTGDVADLPGEEEV